MADLVAERAAKSEGPMSAKRMLPIAPTAGHPGSERGFRDLVDEGESVVAQKTSPLPTPGGVVTA